jgi:hypothetical protein
MVHAFAVELLWLVQRNVTGSPAPVTVTAQTSRHQHPVFSKRLFGAYPPHLFPIPHLIHAPSTVHFADTRPHSLTALAYEPITHTSIIGSTHAIYGEIDHASTCAYRLLSYPICQLGSHNVTLSHCLFPMTL